MNSSKKRGDFPYKALMDLYEPLPIPPSNYWDTLKKRVESAPRTKAPWSAGKLVTGFSGLAAAAVLAVLLMPRSLGVPVNLADGVGPSRTPTEAGVDFRADTGELTLVSQGERIVLAPGAEMRVEALGTGTAFHTPGNRYILRAGQMELDHESSHTTFEVRTPFGTITPLGTALRAQVTPESLMVHCLRGKIHFLSNDGKEKILEAGSSLVWPEEIPVAGEDSLGLRSPDGQDNSPESPPGGVPVSDQGPPVTEVTAAVPGTPTTESAGFSLRELWSLSLDAPVEEGTLVSDTWILRTTKEAWAVEGNTGRIASRWRPESPLWTQNDGRLVDYVPGKVLMKSTEGRLVWEAAVPPLSLGRLGTGPSGIWAASADSSLSLYNPGDGALVRRFTLGTGSYGEPVEREGKILVSTLDRRFSALDVVDGKLIWSASLPERLVGDRPLVWNGQVLVKDRAGKLSSLDLESGKILWSLETGNTLQPGVLALPDRLFLRTSGGTVLVNRKGEDMGWAGGTVLAVLSMGGNRLLTAEPDGIYFSAAGRRENYRKESIQSAFAQGKNLAIQGLEGNLRMFRMED